MMNASQWKTRTFAAGRSRSKLLKAIDTSLQACAISQSAANISALCTAVENWTASKSTPGQPSGYAAVIGGTRDRSGAVQELVTDLRQIAGKPAYWPDKDKGSTYVVTLDEPTRNLLRDMRADAAGRAVSMIAAMDVDWTSFAFDQIGSFGSLAIDLGHTDYGGTWQAAQNNATSIGQFESTAAGKIFNVILDKANQELVSDERVENVLKGAGLGITFVLGVVKYHLFKEGVMSKAVPFFGPVKDTVDAIASGSVNLRLEQKSFRRVNAAKSLIVPNSDVATAFDSFETLLKIETTKTVTDMSYRLLKDTAVIVTSVFTMGASSVIQIVASIVEVVVGFVYQLVYCLVFQQSVGKCREWTQASASPSDLDFRGWSASCPLLGAYFLVGTAAGGGATTALSMFSQPGVAINSTDFQGAAVKLLKVRQSAAAFINRSPVSVKWTGPNGEKYKWIDGLIEHDATSASVGLAMTKMHHFMEPTSNASRGDRARHRFYEAGNKAWSVAKTTWSVV
ncbi:MAG: hypothetical protein HKN42_14960 [Granulosicoccus sp.]|nr:hypothetical protein [Granulosicoccus sp.]